MRAEKGRSSPAAESLSATSPEFRTLRAFLFCAHVIQGPGLDLRSAAVPFWPFLGRRIFFFSAVYLRPDLGKRALNDRAVKVYRYHHLSTSILALLILLFEFSHGLNEAPCLCRHAV